MGFTRKRKLTATSSPIVKTRKTQSVEKDSGIEIDSKDKFKQPISPKPSILKNEPDFEIPEIFKSKCVKAKRNFSFYNEAVRQCFKENGDLEVRKTFKNTILPKLIKNISAISEDDINHTNFIKNLLNLPWQDPNFELYDQYGQLFLELTNFKPKFKTNVIQNLIEKMLTFYKYENLENSSNKLETWCKNLLTKLTTSIPLMKVQITSLFFTSFPSIPYAMKNQQSFITYLRIVLKFCLTNLSTVPEEQKFLFCKIVKEISKIDSLISNEDNDQQACLCKLLDSAMCEILNSIIVYKPKDLIQKAILEDLLINEHIIPQASLTNFTFFSCANLEAKYFVKLLLNKVRTGFTSTNVSAFQKSVSKKSTTVLTSFISHSNIIPKNIIQTILKEFVNLSSKYIQNVKIRDDENYDIKIEKHGHFYNLVEGILQIIVSRQSLLFYENDVTFIKSLNLNRILLNDQFNPLIFCLQSSTELYDKLMVTFNLPNVSAKLAQNREIKALKILSSGITSENGNQYWNPLNFVDLFNKNIISYLPQTTSRFINEIYVKFVDILKVKQDLLLDISTHLVDENNLESDSDFDDLEVDEIPVLSRMMKREREISESKG